MPINALCSQSVPFIDRLKVKAGTFVRKSTPIDKDSVFFYEKTHKYEVWLLERLDKIAKKELKNPRITFNYPKAAPEDLKKLTSNTIEDSYNRAVWINPKDEKIYNIIGQGKTKDGKIRLRILDKDGQFVKETELTRPKIIILDDMVNKQSQGNGLMLSHGECVEAIAKRTFPFCDYEVINTAKDGSPFKRLKEKLTEIYNRIQEGEKIDFVSISTSYEIESLKRQETPSDINSLLKKQLAECREYLEILASGHPALDGIQGLLRKLSEHNCRVFIGAGNSGEKFVNVHLIDSGAIGVGALNRDGNLREFSASRLFTKVNERGVYPIKVTKYGINITDLPGTDLKKPAYLPSCEDELNIGQISGTSFATPVAAALCAAEKMMRFCL